MGAAALAVSLVACVPPPPPHVPAVTIVEPAAGATVTSPMHVTGTVLTTQRLMASCGTSCPGAFDTTVSFQSAPGPLTLTAYTLSAKDGSRIDETSVALVAG